MGEVISEEQPRIKFKATWQGQYCLDDRENAELDHLSKLQSRMEELGVIPVLNDGLVGGNCSMLLSHDPSSTSSTPPPDNTSDSLNVLISRSGKSPGAPLTRDDFVLLLSFDRTTWSACYKSKKPENRPSSDSPLHAAALAPDCCQRYGWAQAPRIAVHGHALAEGPQLEAAKEAGMPISPEETLFSTPEDLQALEALFRKYPYPENKCFIRRGHGFLLLAETVAEAEAHFEAAVLPLLG